jgi:hypothetical protein
MQQVELSPDTPALARHRDAWLTLLRLERDFVHPGAADSFIGNTSYADKNLRALISYLTEETLNRVDTNLSQICVATYAGSGKRKWPPPSLSGGNTLSNNLPVFIGLRNLHSNSVAAQTHVQTNLFLLNDVTDSLFAYHSNESDWLSNNADPCAALSTRLLYSKQRADAAMATLRTSTNLVVGGVTNVHVLYARVEADAVEASSRGLKTSVDTLTDAFGDKSPLLMEVQRFLAGLIKEAGSEIRSAEISRSNKVHTIDDYCLGSNKIPSYQLRWRLYANACALAAVSTDVTENDFGTQWTNLSNIKGLVANFKGSLGEYRGPDVDAITNACNNIARQASDSLEARYVVNYAMTAEKAISNLFHYPSWSVAQVTKARTVFSKIEADLEGGKAPTVQRLSELRGSVPKYKNKFIASIDDSLRKSVGFPITLIQSPAAEISLANLKSFKDEVNSLQSELKDPIWSADKGATSVAQKTCDHFVEVANLLIKGDGTAADWELHYIGAPLDKEDSMVARYYRNVQVTMEHMTNADLTMALDGEPLFLGKGGADSRLSIFLKKNEDPKTEQVRLIEPASWGLLRLLASRPATVSDNGWRIRINVPIPGETKIYAAVFEVRPTVKPPKGLPNLDEWKALPERKAAASR